MTLGFVSSVPMVWILRAVVGLSFLYYGVAKLGDLPAFVEGAVSWGVLRPAATRPLARALPFVEVTVGAALTLGIAVRAAATAAIVTLAVFAVAVSLNLMRGKRVPCFCAGAASKERVGVATLLRIAVLGSFAYVVSMPTAALVPLSPPSPLDPGLLGTAKILELSIVLSIGTLLAILPALEVSIRELAAVRRERRAESNGMKPDGRAKSPAYHSRECDPWAIPTRRGCWALP